MKLYKATAEGLIEFSEQDYLLHKQDQENFAVEYATYVRERRKNLLAETDWTQAADVPQATKDKYAVYRQALRDVPLQPGFPLNIEWPSKP